MTGPDQNKILAYRSPRAPEEATEYLGMVVFLCGWAMLFAGLFMAYGVIRSSSQPWPPPGLPRPPRLIGGAGTLLILGASLAQRAAVQALTQARRRFAVQAMFAALALGSAFLALQLAVCKSLGEEGLALSTGSYASIFYVLTGFHALHLAVGEGALLFLIAKTARGLYNPGHLQPVRLWSLYLHSVTAVWCVTYAAVYLA